MKTPFALLSLLTLFLSGVALGAACCGAGSLAPTILTGDDSAQVATSLAFSQIIGDAPSEGLPVFRAPGDTEQLETARLDGAFLLADRWQAGFSLPFSRRLRRTTALDSAATGFGDVGVDLGYETLPEWDYSAWKPHVFLFTQLTIPLGTSIYDFQSSLAVDAMGRGLYSLSFGALALKTFGHWDLNALAEWHRSFPRTFDNAAEGALSLSSGTGASVGMGAGYSLGALRFGLNVSPAYESPMEITQSGTTLRSSYQLVWNTALQMSYMPASDWSVSLAYNDQTLLGPAVNVALNRGGSFLLQKRWPR